MTPLQPCYSELPLLPVVHQLKHMQIVDLVCHYFEKNFEDLKGKSRKREKVLCRNMCYLMLYNKTTLTLDKIGDMFGFRHHTTVMNGIASIKDIIETEYEAFQAYEYLNKKIPGYAEKIKTRNGKHPDSEKKLIIIRPIAKYSNYNPYD